MKKNFLFGTLAVLLAGFWFGGASLAACTDTDVACLNDTGYPSLKAAIEASVDNDVITLLGNDEVSFDGSNLMLTIDKGITIEGNGKYIKGVSNGYDSWHVTLIKGDKNITIKDLTFKNFGDTLGFDTNGTTTPIYVHKTYGGKLTLENVNIESFNSRGIVFGNGSFVIDGGKIIGSSSQSYQQAIESYVSQNSSISGLEITGVKDLVDGEDVTDAYGIMHAGNGNVTVTNTKINGERCAAISSPTSAWASALSYTQSNGKLILGEGNEFVGTKTVLAISPMGDPVEQSSSSTIEVNDGKYNGSIEKSGDTSVAEAKIEISGGKFSADSSAYVVGGKVAKSISDGDYKYEVANPDPAPSYSGGGGSRGGSSSSSSSTSASTTDTKADTAKAEETKAEETKAEETKGNEDNGTNNGNDGAPAPESKYSQEMIDAYNWAFKNGITTMPTIDEADMEGKLTRIAMAKMLSFFAINVLGKTPDTDRVVPNFSDVDAQLDKDYDNGVTLAYQLGIMGIGIEEFRPNDEVTRGEFATALSRLLFNTPDGEGAFYEPHLAKLMEEKIITVDTPDLKELRGYVMIMLMRSAQ